MKAIRRHGRVVRLGAKMRIIGARLVETDGGSVVAGLVPAIHVVTTRVDCKATKYPSALKDRDCSEQIARFAAWMAGTSPAMTDGLISSSRIRLSRAALDWPESSTNRHQARVPARRRDIG
jgi:hypothetical protein